MVLGEILLLISETGVSKGDWLLPNVPKIMMKEVQSNVGPFLVLVSIIKTEEGHIF